MTLATVEGSVERPGGQDVAGVSALLRLKASTDPSDPDIGYAPGADAEVLGEWRVPVNRDGSYTFTNVRPNNQVDYPAPAYIGVATAALQTNGPLNITSPTGLAGDHLVAVGALGAVGDTLAIGAGWTLVAGPLDSSTTTRLYVWYKIDSGVGGDTVTLTKTGTTEAQMRGVVYRLRGAGLGLDTSSTATGTSSAVTWATLTPAAANELSVLIGAWDPGLPTTQTPPSGYTERHDSGSFYANNVGISDRRLSTDTATGALTNTLTSSKSWAAVHLLFRADAVNSDAITSPANTWYEVELRGDSLPSSARLPRAISVPDSAGPHQVQDILITAPTAVTPSGAAPSSAEFIVATASSSLSNEITMAEAVRDALTETDGDFEGQLWHNPNTGVLKRWNGLTWETTGTSNVVDATALYAVRAASATPQALAVDVDELLRGVGSPWNWGQPLRRARTKWARGTLRAWGVGDSHMTGFRTDTRPHIFHNQAMDMLARELRLAPNNTRYVPFNTDYLNPWTLSGASTATDNTYGLGLYGVTLTNAGKASGTFVCDRVSLVYSKASGAATVELKIDGVSVGSAATAGTARSSYVLDSGVLVYGSHLVEVVVNGGSGTVHVDGAYIWQGDYGKLEFWNAGHSGSGASYHTDATASGASSLDGMAEAALLPDLVLIQTGTNDLLFSTPYATLLGYYTALITKINTLCSSAPPSIVLMPEPRNSYSSGDDSLWEGQWRANWQAARAFDNVAVFDVGEWMGGIDDDDWGHHDDSSDTVHAGTDGHTAWGSALGRFLLSALGPAPVSEWAIPQAVEEVSAATYTFVSADVGKLKTSAYGSATTWTLPPISATFAAPVGCCIDVLQTGAGQVTIAAGSGVTINNRTGLKAAGQHARLTLQRITANTWQLSGETTA